jgi:hypothetical protein
VSGWTRWRPLPAVGGLDAGGRRRLDAGARGGEQLDAVAAVAGGWWQRGHGRAEASSPLHIHGVPTVELPRIRRLVASAPARTARLHLDAAQTQRLCCAASVLHSSAPSRHQEEAARGRPEAKALIRCTSFLFLPQVTSLVHVGGSSPDAAIHPFFLLHFRLGRLEWRPDSKVEDF